MARGGSTTDLSILFDTEQKWRIVREGAAYEEREARPALAAYPGDDHRGPDRPYGGEALRRDYGSGHPRAVQRGALYFVLPVLRQRGCAGQQCVAHAGGAPAAGRGRARRRGAHPGKPGPVSPRTGAPLSVRGTREGARS